MTKSVVLFLICLLSISFRLQADTPVLNNVSADTSSIDLLLSEATDVQYSDLDKYFQYSRKALDLAQKIDDKGRSSNALLKIGFYHFDKNDFKNALSYFLQSLTLAEKAADQKRVADALFSLGNVHYMLNDHSKSVEYYSKCRSIYEQLNNIRGQAMVSNTLAVIFMDRNETDSAIANYNRAVSFYDLCGAFVEKGQVLTNMSYVYNELGAYEKAIEMANEGKKSALKAGDKIGAAKSMVSLAGIFNNKKDHEQAHAYYQQAAEIALAEDDKHLLQVIYSELSAMYRSTGDYQKALDYFQTSIKYKDSIFSIESTNQMSELQTRFETDKKEKEIALLTKDKEREKIIRNAVIAGLILVISLAFYIFRNYRIKKKANKILTDKNIIIEEKNKNIRDSINYAQRIQHAILPKEEEIKAVFKDAFVLYKPKDVVSGDFYSFAQKDGRTIIAAVDCTGHGVPGAFMSMIGHDQLNHIIIEKNIVSPSEILNHLNRGIKSALKQRDNEASETRDGMDVALCSIDQHSKTIAYAGAHRPLYYINGSLNKIDPDKVAIGGTTDEQYCFKEQLIKYAEGDTVYLFSDGYADQFGGEKGKKFTTKRFREVLESVQHMKMTEQKQALDDALESWKGNLEQVDDVMVIGLKL